MGEPMAFMMGLATRVPMISGKNMSSEETIVKVPSLAVSTAPVVRSVQ